MCILNVDFQLLLYYKKIRLVVYYLESRDYWLMDNEHDVYRDFIDDESSVGNG